MNNQSKTEKQNASTNPICNSKNAFFFFFDSTHLTFTILLLLLLKLSSYHSRYYYCSIKIIIIIVVILAILIEKLVSRPRCSAMNRNRGGARSVGDEDGDGGGRPSPVCTLKAHSNDVTSVDFAGRSLLATGSS